MKRLSVETLPIPAAGTRASIWKSASARLVPALLALVSLALLPTGHAQTADRAVVGDRLVLGGSIKEVAADGAAAKPEQAALVRPSLNREELDSQIGFEVGLQMRDLKKLQERLAAGGRPSPAELEADHLPSADDFKAVEDWLTSQGFTIKQRDGHRVALFATGTIERVQTAFQTRFAQVTFEGETSLAAVTAPSVPARLSAVLGVVGLQPFIHAHTYHTQLQPASENESYYMTSEIRNAYGADQTGLTGAGQQIGIIIDAAPLDSDLTQFWSDNNVDQNLNRITTINTPFYTGNHDDRSTEETLDVEWSSGVAPHAMVAVFVTGNLTNANLDGAYSYIGNQLQAQQLPYLRQLSMSYGGTEKFFSMASINMDTQYFAIIASYGVSSFASSGDNGAFGGSGSTVSVSYPSSDPDVCGVGGTSLQYTDDGIYAGETAWSSDGTGFSDGRIAASGGGTSVVFDRPPWQKGEGIKAGPHRLVPDVALPADQNHGAYLIYTDPKTGDQSMYTSGGTSWASPAWAGFCALLNEGRADGNNTALGLVMPLFYPFLNTGDFNDITQGNNGHYGKNDGYSAGTGYDQVTGIGSPYLATLAPDLLINYVSFGTSNYDVNESAGSITVHVLRSGPGDAAVTIHCATSGGTAASGTDYTGTSRTLSWGAGDMSQKAFTVSINDLKITNGSTRHFTLNLSGNAAPEYIGNPGTATVTIHENDPVQGELEFAATGYSVNDDGSTLTVHVNRSVGSTGAVSVTCGTSSGTAKSGTDYTGASKTLSWADGDKSQKTFSVTTKNRGTSGGNGLQFSLKLSSPTGGAILGKPATATVTIN